MNVLVTNGNIKLCCWAFILALFHSTTANKIYSEHIQDYKKLLQVTVKKIEVFSSLRLISVNFRLKVSKIAKNGTLVSWFCS